jgi:WD40 repeat protein
LDILDAADGHLLRRLPLPDLPHSVSVSPDGHWLAAGCANDTLSVWDTATWNGRILSDADFVDGLTFSRDGNRLLAANDEDNVAVWDLRTGQLLARLRHNQTTMDAAYSPDGKRIVTAGDNTVRVWDAATFRELTSVTGLREQAVRARFTSDGKSIIGIDIYGKAIVWQATKPDAVEITK